MIKVTEVRVERLWKIFWRVSTVAQINSSYPMLDHDPFTIHSGPILFRSWAERLRKQIELKYFY